MAQSGRGSVGGWPGWETVVTPRGTRCAVIAPLAHGLAGRAVTGGRCAACLGRVNHAGDGRHLGLHLTWILVLRHGQLALVGGRDV